MIYISGLLSGIVVGIILSYWFFKKFIIKRLIEILNDTKNMLDKATKKPNNVINIDNVINEIVRKGMVSRN